MTAHEEAEELVTQFIPHTRVFNDEFGWEDDIESAKRCALIAIEFAADQFEKYCCAEMGTHYTKDDEYSDGTKDHFRYIKEAVEKI